MKEVIESKKGFRLVIIGITTVVLFAIVLGILGFIIGNRLQNTSSGASTDLLNVSSKCIAEGGTWFGDTRECENVSEPFCRSLFGNYDACASPCRNMAGEVMCIQQCIQVCSFK